MTQIIVLALDGEAILLKNILVTPSMQLADKDVSGQASSTANAEQGNKGKELRISGLIPFEDKTQLTRLFALAEATDASGARKKYRVAHEVAQTIKFRQATFSGNIDAAPQTDRMAWLVNFTLKEYLSVAEKKSMQTAETATVQTSSGTASAEETAEQLSWFENVLKKIDTAIGPAGTDA
ncbi:baseplate complex protein [Erwinia psidii]|uniref:Uncharacterized protein n=1 Tax=Erwinia psidii TaxID=69224 RepID=A0A3N6SN14_9GAMM|nr:hypothetical protein [Erwinia psidii]RQM39116.1 hypothetical protein EB241_04990 [Erwinia psidii]